MMEEWNNGKFGFVTFYHPSFQYSIMPVFSFIPTLFRQGNTKKHEVT
jgi:hypothetical protein